jgi:hypothetical protein
LRIEIHASFLPETRERSAQTPRSPSKQLLSDVRAETSSRFSRANISGRVGSTTFVSSQWLARLWGGWQQSVGEEFVAPAANVHAVFVAAPGMYRTLPSFGKPQALRNSGRRSDEVL